MALMTAIATIVAYWVGQDAGFRLLPWSRSPQPVEVKAPKSGENLQ